MHFPLSGRVRDFHPLDYAHVGRTNNALLAKAKAAWSTNPTAAGAREACTYLSQVVISSSHYKNEVETLFRQIQGRMISIEDQRLELAKLKVQSETQLKAERINASARVTSSFINSLPTLVFNILKWL